MQVETLSDPGGMEREWWDLWYRDPASTPFQSPAWLLPWRKHFSDGDSVVLTFRQDGRLVAIVPLFRHEDRLMLWGAGTTDWLDGVFDPEFDSEVLPYGIETFSLPLDLFQIRPSSPLLDMRAPGGWNERVGLAESCAVLSLPACPSRKMAQNLRYYRRRAERAAIGEPHLGSAGDFEALADLHERWWNRRDEPGVFADPRMLAWQHQTLTALEAAGLLRLHVLRSGSETVAALCVVGGKERSFYYIGGFDPDRAALGLGTILIGHAIGEAEREGHRSFDFLRGRENYKYRWGAVDQPSHARYLAPPQRAMNR